MSRRIAFLVGRSGIDSVFVYVPVDILLRKTFDADGFLRMVLTWWTSLGHAGMKTGDSWVLIRVGTFFQLRVPKLSLGIANAEKISGVRNRGKPYRILSFGLVPSKILDVKIFWELGIRKKLLASSKNSSWFDFLWLWLARQVSTIDNNIYFVWSIYSFFLFPMPKGIDSWWSPQWFLSRKKTLVYLCQIS